MAKLCGVLLLLIGIFLFAFLLYFWIQANDKIISAINDWNNPTLGLALTIGVSLCVVTFFSGLGILANTRRNGS